MSNTMNIIGMAGRTIDRFEYALEDRDARIVELQKKLAKAESELKSQQMHTAGLMAQREHLKSLGAHASDALKLSGQFYKTKIDPKTNKLEAKTLLALVYEKAFDAKGQELGVKNPKEWRFD